MSITHVFDSSAFLAHILKEPGSSQVTSIWEDTANTVGVAAHCICELKTRIREILPDPKLQHRIFEQYRSLVTVIDVSEEVALEADELRTSSKKRLPLSDALVAATAKLNGAILVHRDEHLSQLDQGSVRQFVLPPKAKLSVQA